MITNVKILAEINQYTGQSVNPMDYPNEYFELYSVPSYDNNHPEIVQGKDIGSSKVTTEENDVLICKINPRINRVWVVKHYTEYKLLASSEWIIVRNPEINSNYLKWFFSSPSFRILINSQVAGIGGSLTRAQPKQVAKYPVPLPSREEQDRIAIVLDGIDNLISLRKKQLQKLDDLIKSRFVEMFGELKTNTRHWEILTFDRMTEFITDGEHATPRRVNRGIYLLSARNVLNHTLQLDDVDYIDQEEYERIAKRVVPKEGDILISCSGTVGRCCCVPAGLKFQMVRSAALIRFKKSILPIFAEYMVTSDFLQEQINQAKTASSQANLFQGKIAKLKGFIPPMELQEQFADVVKQVNKSKSTIQQGLDKFEQMKQALMQKYFV